MPVRIRQFKPGHYRVSTPTNVHAKDTTKLKAQRQTNLLRGIEHGWHPTGKPARESLIATQAILLVDEVVTQAREIHEVAFIRAGDRVHHKIHGTGTVKHMVGGDEGAVVNMDKGGTKKVKFSGNDSDTGWRRSNQKKKK